MLLKDVFDYSLEEIADLVDSTVGGVKSALNCGRTKLARLPELEKIDAPRSLDTSKLLQLYVERFNQHDWDGVRELPMAPDFRELGRSNWAQRNTEKMEG